MQNIKTDFLISSSEHVLQNPLGGIYPFLFCFPSQTLLNNASIPFEAVWFQYSSFSIEAAPFVPSLWQRKHEFSQIDSPASMSFQ